MKAAKKAVEVVKPVVAPKRNEMMRSFEERQRQAMASSAHQDDSEMWLAKYENEKLFSKSKRIVKTHSIIYLICYLIIINFKF